MSAEKKRTIYLLVGAIIIVVIDQLTKAYIMNNFQVSESVEVIPGLFSITYVKNPGAAFGILANAHEMIRRPVLLLVPVLAVIWLVILIWQSRKEHIVLGLSYALILSGAIGNLIDRFFLSFVVDFLDFYWGTSHFPAFNVADSCITVGAILLVYDFAFLSRKKGGDTPPQAS